VRALIIQHDPTGPAGHVSNWLAARGDEQDVWLISGEEREVDPLDYDLIVTLGSESAAHDDSVPWLDRELGLLRRAFDADVPMLGICFGSQILARALGGRAMPAAQAEIGWVAVTSRDPELIPAGPWFEWHYDTFTPPPGAVLLAESPAAPQAYMLGRTLAVQFHPEVTPEMVDAWLTKGHDLLVRDGVDGDRVLAEMRERDDENREGVWRLLDAFMDRVAGAQRISNDPSPSGASSLTSTVSTSA
jgi:GMP synthase-like glutamine amidotransferase